MMNYQDIFCHQTNDPDVFLYIEKNTQTAPFILKGWIASTKEITNIKLGIEHVHIENTIRQDVIDSYNVNGIKLKTATDIEFSLDSNTQAFDPIYVNDFEIGTLEKFYVYYSGITNKDFKDLIVVENFYEDPDAVRHFALKNLDFNGKDSHRGYATSPWTLHGTKEKFEYYLDKKIVDWYDPGYRNGEFQYILGQDPIVHHVDENSYAGIIYLTPDAPVQTGTSFYKSKITNRGRYDHDPNESEEYTKVFNENFYNRYMFEEIDRVGNVYNRLVIWDSYKIHAATEHFGTTPENSRLFHIFFFDVE